VHKTFKVNQHVLLKNSANKILILKQEGRWMLPGGRLEGMGNPEEELRREIKEETGLEDFKIEGVFDTGISPSGDTFLVTYKVKTKGGTEVKISKEHTDYAWVDKDNVNHYDFWHKANKEKILRYLK